MLSVYIVLRFSYVVIQEAEENRLRKEFEMEGKQVLPKQESEVSDSNIITPGTVFMHELSIALQAYINHRLKDNVGWKGIEVCIIGFPRRF